MMLSGLNSEFTKLQQFKAEVRQTVHSIAKPQIAKP